MSILDYISQHRFVTIRDLSQGLGVSENSLLKPLTNLLESRNISREELPRDGLRGGRMPFVYRIEKVGVSNLKKHNQESAQYIQAGQSHAKNESKKHALMISNFLSLAESSIRQHANRTFINERQIKQQQFGTPKQITWPVTMNLKGMSITLRTVPDAVFGIVNETKSTAEYFFLEADRGTMPIDPTTWDRSSLAKKVAAYHASYQHQLYAQHLGLKGVRVIFFVPTRTRLLSLISLCSQCPNGRGLFLAVDLETIQAHDSLFDIPFISGSGKLRYIV